MIVIIASEDDCHADAIVAAIADQGYKNVFRIDFEKVMLRNEYSIKYDGSFSDFNITCPATGHSVDRKSCSTVYWRRSNSTVKRDHWSMPVIGEVDDAEAYWAIRMLMESLSDNKYPFGHPRYMDYGGNKLLQLKVASESGLSIPQSRLSNVVHELLQFSSKHKKVVIKPLKTMFVNSLSESDKDTSQSKISCSQSVNSNDIAIKLSNAGSTQLFMQECVDKVADIRLNIFGEKSNACRISNAKLAPNTVDWRSTTFDHDHEIIDTPVEIEKACRDYLKRMNLKWGAFDFGLKSDGSWVFFECNPNGQWLWIQLKTGYPLAQEFAKYLLKHEGVAFKDSSLDGNESLRASSIENTNIWNNISQLSLQTTGAFGGYDADGKPIVVPSDEV